MLENILRFLITPKEGELRQSAKVKTKTARRYQELLIKRSKDHKLFKQQSSLSSLTECCTIQRKKGRYSLTFMWALVSFY